MKAISAKATRGLNIGSLVIASDNSGAIIVRIVSVKKGKSVKKRQQYAKIADWVKVSVRKRRPYRRKTGERIAFSDNAVALLKDDKGNPKGTQIKGPIAREISERWPSVSKIARIVV